MANLVKTVKMAKIRHSVMNKSNDMAKGPVQSSDFGHNGQFDKNGENSPKSAKIQMRWQRAPLKVAVLTKIASMAKIRHRGIFKTNGMAKRHLKKANLMKMANLAQNLLKRFFARFVIAGISGHK